MRWEARFVRIALILLLLGFLFSALHGLSRDGLPLLASQENYETAFIALGRSGEETPYFAQRDLVTSQERLVEMHAHFLFFCILLILAGVTTRWASGPSRLLRWGLSSLSAGIIIYPSGLGLQAIGALMLGEAITLLGAIAVIAGIGSLLWRLSTTLIASS